ncbi:MAG: hypothetical protein M3Y43_07405 [Pseudomonadota bacterium]|nr:hypothetical protein [Pseudomonadota bacterium]
MSLPCTPSNIIRFNEQIHGRSYVIEVLPVGRSQWRAQIARSGGATAVMPFYGTTPDEAARLLSVWLNRAGKPRASGTP